MQLDPKALELLDEGLEILTNLTDSIARHGNYSPESTCTFIDQAASSFREAKGILQAVQPVPVVADEYASATYTDEQKRKLQADAGIPNIPTNLTYECRLAISGEGERSYDWSDKPHRLVYDLCRQIEALTATASAEPVGYRWQWSVRNDGEWYYGPHHPVDGSQSSIDGDPDIIEPLYAAPVSGADNAK